MRRLLSYQALVCLIALSASVAAQGPPPPPPPLNPPPVPPENPLTTAKINLGKALFYEEQVASNRTMACASCHVLGSGGSDPRTSVGDPACQNRGADGIFGTGDDVFGSPGTSRLANDDSYKLDPVYRMQPQVTSRKAPSVINAAYVPNLFWDGRALSQFRDPLTSAVVINSGGALESQSMFPPVGDVEMAHEGRDWNDVAARVAASTPLRLSPSIPGALSTWINGRDYPSLFLEAFGTSSVTPARIGMAIASYERTLWTNQAPWDAFNSGTPSALTPQEQQGLQIFTGQGRCVVCHAGNRFTDDSFRYIGVRPQNDDLGRFNVTGLNGDRGRMKVPSLRNVSLRAPYFHNGEMATIEDVVDFYNRGGDFNAPNKDPAIAPIGLNATQKAALAAFLRHGLLDPRVASGVAPFDRPLLSREAPLAPQPFGVASAGTNGETPLMVAFEPPYVGNPHFTLAVDHGNAGRQGFLLVSEQSTAGVLFQGATLYVPVGGRWTVIRKAITGTGPGEGIASASFAIPSDALLVGTTFYAQWASLDPTPGHRLSASAAVACTRF